MAFRQIGAKSSSRPPFYSLTSQSFKVNRLDRDNFVPFDKSTLTGRRALTFEPEHLPDQPIRDIRWRPVSKIRPEDGHEWSLFCDRLAAWDVRQNDLGDCWLLAALSALLHVRPDIVRKMVTGPVKKKGLNIYQVRLFYDGRPVIVSVSDVFPVKGNGRLKFGVALKSQLFVPLIEKALAYLIHSYEALEAGFSLEAFSAFTGYPSKKIQVDANESDQLWETMLAHSDSRFPMVASTSNHTILTEKNYEDVGLSKDHAYAIYDLVTLTKPDGSEVRLIRMHNVNKIPKWTGPYRDRSPEWTKDLLAQLATEDLAPDKAASGVFWLEYDKFRHYFVELFVGYVLDEKPLSPAFHEIRYDAMFPRWGDEARYHTAYVATVPERKSKKKSKQQHLTTLHVTAYQQCHRAKPSPFHPNLCFGLAVFRLDPLDKNVVGVVHTFSGCSFDLQQCCELSQLEPGEYLVLLLNFDTWPGPDEPPSDESNAARERYILTFHSSLPVSVVSHCCPMSLQGEALFELVKLYGRKEKVAGYGRVYTLSHEDYFTGFVVAVENRSHEQSLECFLKYEPEEVEKNINICSNVLLTRGSHSTFDVIPPYSWQIICIAQPFSDKMEYRVGRRFLVRNFFPVSYAAPAMHDPELGRNASIHSVRKITYHLSD